MDKIREALQLAKNQYAASDNPNEAKIDEALALLDTQGWQDISTAPHGKLVLLATPIKGHGGYIMSVDFASGGQNINGVDTRWIHGQATHWMPLPPPPISAVERDDSHN